MKTKAYHANCDSPRTPSQASSPRKNLWRSSRRITVGRMKLDRRQVLQVVPDRRDPAHLSNTEIVVVAVTTYQNFLRKNGKPAIQTDHSAGARRLPRSNLQPCFKNPCA
jgi:hypothetical protein